MARGVGGTPKVPLPPLPGCKEEGVTCSPRMLAAPVTGVVETRGREFWWGRV